MAGGSGRVPWRGLALIAWVALAGLLLVQLWTRSSEVVFEAESEFGGVRVVERRDGLRSLYTGSGRGRQSAIFPGRPRHLELAYTRLGTIGLALVPPDGRILFVGLGGGAMPMFTRQVLPAARIDVVEIDPLVVHAAIEYFGFGPDSLLRVHTDDGRALIEDTPPGTFDLIVLDAFSDDSIPFTLTTLEFLETVRSRLAPGGAVVSNLWSTPPEYPSMLATYSAVFDDVHLIRVERRQQRILVARHGQPPLDRGALEEAATALEARADLGFDLSGLVRRGYEGAPATTAPVLRDTRAAELSGRDWFCVLRPAAAERLCDPVLDEGVDRPTEVRG